MLSFVAGIVNVSGLQLCGILTTNVTGHFAYFSRNLILKNYIIAIEYLFFIVSFLSGAFVSNFLIEGVLRKKASVAYIIPMVVETIILIAVSLISYHIPSIDSINLVPLVLLFAMGIQNALVTKVSNSVVRTTHLTGLFTDLGIELSQLFFYKKTLQKRQLIKNIYLKFTIICCFFFGCTAGGFLFIMFNRYTLLFAAAFLVLTTLYDNIRFLFYKLIRKK